MKSPLVYVVILNWNGWKDTIDCLKSLELVNTKNFSLKILIVDNDSTDDSLKRLKDYSQNITNLSIVENKSNLGFAEGNNVGIRHAIANGADYILVLNNDTIVHQDLIFNFVDYSTTHKNAGALTGKIYFAKGYEYHKSKYKKTELGRVIWSAGGDMDWANVYGTNHGVDEVDNGQYDKILQTDFATGACAFYSVAALKEVGMFDPKYYLYLEDLDLSQRLKLKKWEVVYLPKAVCWHKVSQSSGIGSNLNDYFITRNRLLFGIKYAPKRTKAALIKESVKFLAKGRKWQRIGVMDYYVSKFGKGSWK